MLASLDKVREVAPGKWTALCPSHDDKTPSLSIRELDDGRLLLFCFAGCGAGEVLSAVGMELRALFPDKPQHHRAPLRRERLHAHAARQALRALAADVVLVGIAAEDVARDQKLSETDRVRLWQAIRRIQDVAGVTCGNT